MNTLVKVGIGIGAAALAVAVIPALRGPLNRAKNTVSEKLNQEFVVDNYKAEYVSLHDKKVKIVESIGKFKVEQKVAEKKLKYAEGKKAAAKAELLKAGTSDLTAFNRAKDAYESAKIEVDNYATMGEAYSNAIVKLESSLYLVNSNMAKAKTNVAALESKKALVDNIKAVNETVEDLNGIGDGRLGVSIEKLDDDALRESIRLDALRESCSPSLDKAGAEAYLNSVR